MIKYIIIEYGLGFMPVVHFSRDRHGDVELFDTPEEAKRIAKKHCVFKWKIVKLED